MTRTIEIPLTEELLRLVDEKARSTGLERDAVFVLYFPKRSLVGLLSVRSLLPSAVRWRVAESATTH
jgi:hypothetical protein